MRHTDSPSCVRFFLRVLVTGLLLAALPATAQTTFTVTSPDEGGDINPGDGLCQSINAACTLRAAIEEANASSDSEILVEFSLSGAPPYTIDVNSSLRIDRDNVTIDGTTQSTASDPEIELDGDGGNHGAFVIEGDSNEIRGLSIIDFGDGGIFIDGNLNAIVDNLIGADTQGNAPGGGGTAIGLLAGSSLNFIGEPGEGNIIVNFFRGIHVGDDDGSGNTGNAEDNLIRDNLIGALSTSGPLAGNTQHGIMIQDSDGNIVGGDRSQSEGNMVVDNGGRGIYAFGSDETNVLGNLVGISPSGDPMGNGDAGIEIEDGNLSQIGEAPNDETGNVVADNAEEGILITATSADSSTGNRIAANEIGAIVLNDGSVIQATNGAAGISDTGDKTVVGGNGSDDGNLLHINGVVLDGTDASVRNNTVFDIDDDCFRVTGSQNSVGGTSFVNGNLITGCDGAGISVEGNDAIENEIAVNSMRFVSGPGIDLGSDGLDENDPGDGDTGPNNRQNSPQVTDTEFDESSNELTVTYRVDSNPANSAYDLMVRFFKDAGGDTAQGRFFLGFDSYVSGDAGSEVTTTMTITTDDFKEGDLVATATDADGNTSEFSRPVRYGGIFEDRFENE